MLPQRIRVGQLVRLASANESHSRIHPSRSSPISRPPPAAGTDHDRVANSPFDLAFAAGHVWVTNFYSNTVTKLREQDGAVVDAITVGQGPAGIAFDGTLLWVANNGSDTVTALRPANGRIIATVPVARAPFGIEISILLGAPQIWVASVGSNSVTMIDPRGVV